MPSLTVQEMRTHDLIQQACNKIAHQGLSKREKVALKFVSFGPPDEDKDENFIQLAFERADHFLRISKETMC